MAKHGVCCSPPTRRRRHRVSVGPSEFSTVSHRLRVVFLVGGESRSTRLSIEAVCKLPGIVPVATLVDTGTDTLQRRWKNLRRNLNRNGFGYLPHRVASALRELTDRAASRAVLDPHEVEHVLRTPSLIAHGTWPNSVPNMDSRSAALAISTRLTQSAPCSNAMPTWESYWARGS